MFALVLSADHVYKMDYRKLIAFHAASGAEVTIATVEYPKNCSRKLGVVEVDTDDRVVAFAKKPGDDPPDSSTASTVNVDMGVYVFNREILIELQKEGLRFLDIGLDLIPNLLSSHKVMAYPHKDPTKRSGYWRDVGTLETYYSASMDLLSANPPLDPYSENWPIRSVIGAPLGARNLLSDVGAEIGVNSVIPHAVDIAGACVYGSVLSPGVVLESGADVRHSVLLPGAVIRRGASVRRAIIDAHVIIEAGDCIGYNPRQDQSRFHTLSNGISVVSPDHVAPFFKANSVSRSELTL